MKLLAFDTAMAACSAAVYDAASGKILGAALAPMDRGQAEALAPMLRSVMVEAGLRFAQLDRIAVTTGPGSFTGVRIGLAMARGLGLALERPVTGIDTLSAIAANEQARPLLVAADARNNEIYAALLSKQGELLDSPAIMKVAECVSRMPEGPATVIGTAAGAIIQSAHRYDLTRSKAEDFPIAANFAGVAAAIHASQAMPSPLYLRAPDAKPQSPVKRNPHCLRIREAGIEEAIVLASLHDECFENTWGVADFEKLLSMPGALALLAFDAEGPVGFVLARQAADEAEIIVIATRPFARRRGAARSLLAELSQRFTAKGATSFFIEVAVSNTAACKLYEAESFKIAGARRAYYECADGVREDALIMRKQLSP